MGNKIIDLKKRVMIRIYLLYIKNKLWEYPDYFMFGFFIASSFMLVSVHDVLNNINNISHTNPSSLFYFFLLALRDTSWVIQVFIVGFLLRWVITGAIKGYKNREMLAKWNLLKFKY